MWLDQQVSLYKCPADNTGRLTTFRHVLHTAFGVEHEWFYKTYPAGFPDGIWESGTANDLFTICEIRRGLIDKPEQTRMKQTMQCFTPAGVFKTKKKDSIEEIQRTGLMQLDFDYNDIKEYDVDELKRCVFDLPFVAFCGLSCSGKGFYALISIAEPYKLNEYAEHCFEVLLKYGIKADTTKGRNPNDLRFVSYDANMLIRESPEALHIKRFKPKPAPKAPTNVNYQPLANEGQHPVLNNGLKQISEATQGNRWATVQKVAFTIGGLGIVNGLDLIKDCINANSSFTGEEAKYYQCATDCFKAGSMLPINQ